MSDSFRPDRIFITLPSENDERAWARRASWTTSSDGLYRSVFEKRSIDEFRPDRIFVGTRRG